MDDDKEQRILHMINNLNTCIIILTKGLTAVNSEHESAEIDRSTGRRRQHILNEEIVRRIEALEKGKK